MRRTSVSTILSYHALCFALFLFPILFVPAFGQTVGEVFPPWSPGVLDIHHISTGKGEATLFIFPDATTMLVDAGESTALERVAPRRPDGSRTPGEWIARYVQQMLPHKDDPALAYVLLTHFHGDHMGEMTTETAVSRNGQYRISGITEVAEYIRIHKILDRGWPDYDWPVPLGNDTMKNYRSFLKWQMEHNGMKVERFQPGRNDQIVLLNEPDNYPEFEVRNVASNGEIWTGVTTNTRRHFPPLEHIPAQDWPSENMCSNAFHLSYGNFDYFNGGDIPGIPAEGAPVWHDIETPIAKAVGPVEVNVLNHHGYIDSENAFFLGALRPRVHIFLTWSPSHPGTRVLNRLLSDRIYQGPRDIFATGIMDETREVVGPGLKKLKSDQGHIIVRVEPRGKEYRVIILDDSAETFKVTGVHGPYESR